jgi:hypothetical protein
VCGRGWIRGWKWRGRSGVWRSLVLGGGRGLAFGSVSGGEGSFRGGLVGRRREGKGRESWEMCTRGERLSADQWGSVLRVIFLVCTWFVLHCARSATYLRDRFTYQLPEEHKPVRQEPQTLVPSSTSGSVLSRLYHSRE